MIIHNSCLVIPESTYLFIDRASGETRATDDYRSIRAQKIKGQAARVGGVYKASLLHLQDVLESRHERAIIRTQVSVQMSRSRRPGRDRLRYRLEILIKR